jgi:hypothetical protein
MNTLPVELVGVILSHVDELTLPCCYAICPLWTSALRHHRRAHPATTGTTTGGSRSTAAVVGLKEFCWLLAHEGRLTVLKWARANGCPWDEQTCSYGAGGGHLEVLQWARANGCPQ